MYFTIVLSFLCLLGLVVIFGVTYKIKGLKAALIATGIAFFVFSILFVAVIYVIANSM